MKRKKLRLSRETILTLDKHGLRHVYGGGTITVDCPEPVPTVDGCASALCTTNSVNLTCLNCGTGDTCLC